MCAATCGWGVQSVLAWVLWGKASAAGAPSHTSHSKQGRARHNSLLLLLATSSAVPAAQSSSPASAVQPRCLGSSLLRKILSQSRWHDGGAEVPTATATLSHTSDDTLPCSPGYLRVYSTIGKCIKCLTSDFFLAGNISVSVIDTIMPLKDDSVCFQLWREQNRSAPKSPYRKHVHDLCL